MVGDKGRGVWWEREEVYGRERRKLCGEHGPGHHKG